MNIFTASMIVEDELGEYTEEQALEAWQWLVDTGYAWRLQGWYGRTAQYLIDMGHLTQTTKSMYA